jgi:preprotein translocase subunit SecA
MIRRAGTPPVRISMLPKLLTSIFGSRNERLLKQYRRVVEQISALESTHEKLSDEQLRGKTAEFRARLAQGAELDSS